MDVAENTAQTLLLEGKKYVRKRLDKYEKMVQGTWSEWAGSNMNTMYTESNNCPYLTSHIWSAGPHFSVMDIALYRYFLVHDPSTYIHRSQEYHFISINVYIQ